MFDKFNHRFRDKLYYDFVVLFAGTFFAMYLILPEEWREPIAFLLIGFASAAVAKFAASNRNRD